MAKPPENPDYTVILAAIIAKLDDVVVALNRIADSLDSPVVVDDDDDILCDLMREFHDNYKKVHGLK